MAPKYFIGIDISKLTLDIAILVPDGSIKSHKIKNTESDFKQFFTNIKQDFGFKNRDIALCAENMGVYALFIVNVCVKKKIPLYFESPLHIKKSLGIQRGKNDKIDAIRIAQFAKKNFDSLRIWEPPRICISKLKTLLTVRKRLLKIKKMLVPSEKINSYYLSELDVLTLTSYYTNSLNAIKKDISSIEKEMMEILQSDERLSHLLDLITSVPRIGTLTAIQILIHTNEFKDITSAKKFASYCGIAPFEYSSGISLKGKTRISPFANKEVKTLLHLAAIGFVSHPEHFLGKYYARKVAEGKNKMSVLNAIRNKLLHRIFACVNNDRKFIEI